MSELKKTARRAQRRLWLNRWFSKLGWALAGAAAVFVLSVLLDRLWLVRPDAELLLGWMSLALLGTSLLASVIWAVITRENLAVSAAALDEAAGLKERISTGIFCEQTDDPFGQAVVTDARRVSRGLTVRRHLPLRFPGSANYAGPTLLVALLVFWLFPVLDLAGKQEARNKQNEEQKRAAKAHAAIQPVLEKQVESFRQKFRNLDKEMEKLVALKGAAPTTRPEDVKNEGIKEMGNIVQKIEDKKQDPDLARIDEFRNIAQKLEAQQRGNSLSSKLAQNLAQGDYKNAQQTLEAMKLELMKAPTTEEQKQKAAELREQMNKLSKQLEQLGNNQKKLENELAKTGMKPEDVKRALEQLTKNQDMDSLKKELAKQGMSQQQIDKLANQLKKCQGGCQMASKLGQSLKQASQGQQGQQGQEGQQGQQGAQGSDQLSSSSEAGFSEAADQLSEMETMQQEMNDLRSAAAEMKEMQDRLAQAGQGDGMGDGDGMGGEEGQGDGMGDGTGGEGGGTGGGMGGLGRGQGGVAPKTETGGRTAVQKAKVNTLPGSIISTQFVNGEQVKGEVSAEFVEAVISAQRDVADAIGREAIPRQYQKSVSKYFSQATEGLPADKVKAAESKVEENKAESDAPAPEAK